MSKRLTSRRRRGYGRFRLSDDCRAPFPGLTPRGPHCATYELTALGRVYRDDGRLLLPSPGKYSRIRLNDRKNVRSLPKALYTLFGTKPLPSPLWCPWILPSAPIDELTGRRSYSMKHLRLAFRPDLQRLGFGTITAEQVQTVRAR